MKKLLLILLFIPLISFGQETKEENSKPVYKITISSGEVIESEIYRINRKKRIIYIQKLDGKFTRLKTQEIVSIKQGEKELFNKKREEDLKKSTKKSKFIGTITYDEIRKTPFLKYKNNLKANEYINKDGISFKVGDTIVVGKPSNNNNLERSTAVQGATNNNFSYIILGSGISIFMGGGLTANEMLSGEEGKIVAIKMVRMSSKEKYKPYLTMHKLNGLWFGIKREANTNIDLAFESGEILKYGLITRKQALNELKQAKELLDLELMSRDEFDAKKKKLSKYILKKN
tara:strand:- start:123 stop:986 length:864 start_codon:yes stop_codon:yes gene_type:complete